MRAELRHKPVDELEVLQLTTSAFRNALVEEHEVEVAGKMYDIAWIETHGDEVTVYALHDEAEDNLLAFLDAILKNATKDKKPVPSSLSGLQALLFLPSEFPHKQIETLTIKHYTSYQFTPSSASLPIDGPPPKNQPC